MRSQTIEELMMFLCTSRFDIEEQEAKLLEKFFSYEEMEAAKEEKDEKLDEVEIDPISDAKEQDTVINDEIGLDAAGEVDEAQLPLPRNNTQDTQVRASGRKRKSRDDDIFEYH